MASSADSSASLDSSSDEQENPSDLGSETDDKSENSEQDGGESNEEVDGDDDEDNDDGEEKEHEKKAATSDDESEEDEIVKEAPKKPIVAKVNKAIEPKKKAAGTASVSTKATATRSNATSSTATKSKSSAAATRAPNKGMKMPEVNGKKTLTTKDMIIHAVADLKDKKGSSTAAIRKYLIDKYDVSQQRLTMITKLLRTAGEEGWLLQTSGSGASSGSHFKLPAKMKNDMQKIQKNKESVARKEEKQQAKAKEATKRKIEKKQTDKEVPAKKKKVTEASTKKTASLVAKKKA